MDLNIFENESRFSIFDIGESGAETGTVRVTKDGIFYDFKVDDRPILYSAKENPDAWEVVVDTSDYYDARIEQNVPVGKGNISHIMCKLKYRRVITPPKNANSTAVSSNSDIGNNIPIIFGGYNDGIPLHEYDALDEDDRNARRIATGGVSIGPGGISMMQGKQVMSMNTNSGGMMMCSENMTKDFSTERSGMSNTGLNQLHMYFNSIANTAINFLPSHPIDIIKFIAIGKFVTGIVSSFKTMRKELRKV